MPEMDGYAATAEIRAMPAVRRSAHHRGHRQGHARRPGEEPRRRGQRLRHQAGRRQGPHRLRPPLARQLTATAAVRDRRGRSTAGRSASSARSAEPVSPACRAGRGRAGAPPPRRTGSRPWPGRWPRPAAGCSSSRCRSAAVRLSSSCSGVRAPRMTEVTAGPVGQPGERHLRHRDAAARRRPRGPRRGPARCAPRRCAAPYASTPRSGFSPSRVAPVGGASRRYLPVSQPPPSGDQGRMPMPSSRQTGTSSNSISRASRLYCGCRVTIGGEAAELGEQDGLLQLPADEVADARRSGSCRRAPRRRGTAGSPRSGSAGPRRAPGRGRSCSTPRRRRLASRARVRWRAGQAERRSGPSPIGKRPLVAITTRSRTPGRAASQRPMISSDDPGA